MVLYWLNSVVAFKWRLKARMRKVGRQWAVRYPAFSQSTCVSSQLYPPPYSWKSSKRMYHSAHSPGFSVQLNQIAVTPFFPLGLNQKRNRLRLHQRWIWLPLTTLCWLLCFGASLAAAEGSRRTPCIKLSDRCSHTYSGWYKRRRREEKAGYTRNAALHKLQFYTQKVSLGQDFLVVFVSLWTLLDK